MFLSNWVILRFAAVNFQGCIGWRMEFLFLSPVPHTQMMSLKSEFFLLKLLSFAKCWIFEGILVLAAA